jgi:hypothetical protein
VILVFGLNLLLPLAIVPLLLCFFASPEANKQISK